MRWRSSRSSQIVAYGTSIVRRLRKFIQAKNDCDLPLKEFDFGIILLVHPTMRGETEAEKVQVSLEGVKGKHHRSQVVVVATMRMGLRCRAPGEQQPKVSYVRSSRRLRYGEPPVLCRLQDRSCSEIHGFYLSLLQHLKYGFHDMCHLAFQLHRGR